MSSFRVTAYVCMLVLLYGCSRKNAAELEARKSEQWIRDAIICEIDLHSFSKEGTFKALEERIPEMKKLGVTLVSLMPIYPTGEFNRSVKSSYPYAVKDHYAINPEFGTSSDFHSLVLAFHREGIKIVLHFIAQYAAWDSPLLMEHPEWFVHNGAGALVSPDAELFDIAQLDFNQHEPRKYMIAAMKYWVKEFDIDGFSCSQSDAVPVNFWERVRKELDSMRPVVMISPCSIPEYHLEAFDLTYSRNMFTILQNFFEDTVTVPNLENSLRAESFYYPKGSLHLRSSIAYDGAMIKDQSSDTTTVKGMIITTVFAFTIPGVPLIVWNEHMVGKLTMPNDKERNDLPGKRRRQDVLSQLIAARQNHPALRYGSFLSLSDTTTKVCSFFRIFKNDTVAVIMNFGTVESEINLRVPANASATWKEQLSGVSFRTKDASLNVVLLPYDYMILTPNNRETAQ
jgi:cyclomaltodextrinase / maltogenic alpha-amylase / neopullulanase